MTLSTQENAMPSLQSKSGFKRVIISYKHQSNIEAGALIGPSFQGIDQLIVLSFEDREQRNSYQL